MTALTISKQLLNDDLHGVVVAHDQGEPVGQLCYAQFGEVVWITQLVVHSDCRRRGVARSLVGKLLEVLPESTVLGVASANRYTIDIVRGYCGGQDLSVAEELRDINVEYLRNKELVGNTMNTQFFVDHGCDDTLPSGWEYVYAGMRSDRR
jgi:predicted GNAT family acetyltransferase